MPSNKMITMIKYTSYNIELILKCVGDYQNINIPCISSIND